MYLAPNRAERLYGPHDLRKAGAPHLRRHVLGDLDLQAARIRALVEDPRGRLLGGNLTVLAGIVGTGYLPDWSGAILFVEEVEENIYRVDRLLTQLKLAGILGRLRGVVFGNCTKCLPGEGYGALTLEEVLRDHIKPLNVPAWSGAMIGHIDRQFTIPEGLDVEIDAFKGTITMLGPAVA